MSAMCHPSIGDIQRAFRKRRSSRTRLVVIAAVTTRAFLILATLALAALSRDAAAQHDAVVDADHVREDGALVDSIPTFHTVAAALDVAPPAGLTPFRILIRAGRYYEKLSIDRPFVHLVGEGVEQTIITYDHSAADPGPNGEGLGTPGSYTLRITAPDFRLENLTVENGFDYPANAAKPDDDPSKISDAQAVALMTTAASDQAAFRNCRISGYQDTVFLDAGRHHFKNCEILGHVDFVFGAGQAVFEDSDIVSRNRANKNPTGYITAPSTPASMPYGFLFVDSRFLKETPDVPAGSVRLGRPWHPGADSTVNGSAVFVNCFMDDHIGPEGYARISSRDAAGARIWFEVGPNSRFFEFENHGPGAFASDQRPTLSAEAARWYTPEQVLAGWHPE